MDIFGLQPSELIFRFIAVILALSIHEYAHALISSVQGDDTPGRYGRLSLNPMAHLDLFGLIALFMFRFGWAKPVPIDPRKYKNPRLGVILTSFAGPFSNLLLAFLSAVVFFAANLNSLSPVGFFITTLFSMNVGLAIFNILPFPPLDGSKIFAEIFRGKVAELIYRIERVGILILFVLLWIPQVQDLFNALLNTVGNYIVNLAVMIVGR